MSAQNFAVNQRMKNLIARNRELALGKKRELLAPNPEFLIYHWSGNARHLPQPPESWRRPRSR